MNDKSFVRDYMAKDVISVKSDTLNEEVIGLMKKTGHDGFPVTSKKGEIVGIITATDFLLKDWAEYVKDIMSQDVIVTQENMLLLDASRVMFRQRISRLPVVGKNGKMKGIITNSDMIRFHIEQSTPTNLAYFKNTLEQLYGIKTDLKRKKIKIHDLRPTQNKIFADELQGRINELKKGLAEPIIVVKAGNRWILVDGHHIAIAALNLGYNKIDSYVIDLKKDLVLGMERTANSNGIYDFDDIEISDDTQIL